MGTICTKDFAVNKIYPLCDRKSRWWKKEHHNEKVDENLFMNNFFFFFKGENKLKRMKARNGSKIKSTRRFDFAMDRKGFDSIKKFDFLVKGIKFLYNNMFVVWGDFFALFFQFNKNKPKLWKVFTFEKRVDRISVLNNGDLFILLARSTFAIYSCFDFSLKQKVSFERMLNREKPKKKHIFYKNSTSMILIIKKNLVAVGTQRKLYLVDLNTAIQNKEKPIWLEQDSEELDELEVDEDGISEFNLFEDEQEETYLKAMTLTVKKDKLVLIGNNQIILFDLKTKKIEEDVYPLTNISYCNFRFYITTLENGDVIIYNHYQRMFMIFSYQKKKFRTLNLPSTSSTFVNRDWIQKITPLNSKEFIVSSSGFIRVYRIDDYSCVFTIKKCSTMVEELIYHHKYRPFLFLFQSKDDIDGMKVDYEDTKQFFFTFPSKTCIEIPSFIAIQSPVIRKLTDKGINEIECTDNEKKYVDYIIKWFYALNPEFNPAELSEDEVLKTIEFAKKLGLSSLCYFLVLEVRKCETFPNKELADLWMMNLHKKIDTVSIIYNRKNHFEKHISSLINHKATSSIILTDKQHNKHYLHKEILSFRSVYFERMFCSGFSESNETVIHMDIEKSLFDFLINFLYFEPFGHVKNINRAFKLYSLADKLLLENLKQEMKTRLENYSKNNPNDMIGYVTALHHRIEESCMATKPSNY